MDFLKNNKRFSFKLSGTDAWLSDYESDVTCNGNELITVYAFKGGIKVTNIAKKYEDFNAYEWVNYIENTADCPSEIISELYDCDCTLPLKHENPKKYESYLPDVNTATKIYNPTGSTWKKKEFYCDVDTIEDNCRLNHIYLNQTKIYSTNGGRSSQEKAPFFNIHKDGEGFIFAIGWTGQWNCSIYRASESITFKSKIEDTYFRLMPGEKIRTSSVVIMPYHSDVIDSQNNWRRLIKEHFSLIGKENRDNFGPLCAGMWGGVKSESVLKKIKTIKENNLPYEYVWMDAGWYGIDTKPTPDEFEGDWGAHTGDWRVSPLIHPNNLEDISKAIHDSGMKFLLWLEPERVVNTTPIAKEHPEYFLSVDNDASLILDLGNEQAWDYCFTTVSNLIEKLKIDCYRQDFNTNPLVFWRTKDEPERKGISEIKYINGLYRFWDELLKKFPNLIIDNCASGGRRIDIETLRRSIPLWRSDYQCNANYDVEASQCHNQSFNMWMPYSGTGSGRPYDEYRIRSSYAAALTTNYAWSDKEMFCSTKEESDYLKKYLAEYLKIRPYFSEDFYPLTEISENLDIWSATQFNRPELKDGVVEIFKRENSPYETGCFKLRGLDINAKYLFNDADGGEFTLTGKELSQNGLKITIKETRKAKIYFYKAI